MRRVLTGLYTVLNLSLEWRREQIERATFSFRWFLAVITIPHRHSVKK
jgi:hypothetical protein